MERSGEPVVEATRQPEVTYWVDERNGRFPLAWWKMLPLVLLIGGAVVALLTLIMIPVYESKVIDNAKDELRAAGIESDTFAFDASYRDLEIRGVLPEGVSASQVESVVENTDGLRDLEVDLVERPAPVIEDEEDEPEEVVPVVETASTAVTADVTADGVVLSGEVPDEQQAALLIAQAEDRFGAGNVTDEIVVRDLEPTEPGARGRVLQLALLIGRLPDGAVGTATISDTELISEWTVRSDGDADAINDTVNGAKGAFVGSSSATITVEAPPIEEEIETLQEEFDELAVEIRENVTFATGSDVLNETATATLDKVVALMATYVNPVVEISGSMTIG